MRLIDADALKKEVSKKKVVGRFNTLSLIDAAQTVVVNCKDCDGYEAGYSAGLKDAERPKGEWTDLSTDGRHIGWIACSVCGQEPPSESNLATDFCPNCGADMRGGDKE